MDSGWPKEACIRWGAHWRNLANTIESSICCGDAAFLSNYFDHLLSVIRLTLSQIRCMGTLHSLTGIAGDDNSELSWLSGR